ncbi:RB1-inducible coiled-coil protein 1 isoform X1 [Leptopilina heterotoma]|uniref:RB1-inducible coiled-coil protein 1 isoform X1 n=1 Tax=Leptopilina heterotoma TaxID=63436 RepID=UPI001CA823E9|nr:RB1-inducible coiled-coil protein 1 isoform X1 [Leptopilina heterotoma]XP_043470314.1 RB1-inducible coiled-coil protein 1 isoform X1 [Leptopilina heterotoma]
MLYIFYVDTGSTITFDIKLALQSVSELKEAIERECGVLTEDQVLLMSGGESLESEARVCSYSAGTDTNPIYLFNKASINSSVPPIPSIDCGSDVDLQSQIDASSAMPATYQTIVARAQLAQQCCGLARDQIRICKRLVHDQHLQQQGWAAVIANLEDVVQMFQSKAEQFQHSFAVYHAERHQYIELLQNYSHDVENLTKIPILPALRAQAEGLLSPDELPTEEEGDAGVLSLFKWISAKDNHSSLVQLAEQCSRGMEHFNESFMEILMEDVNQVINGANKQDLKEIRGLGDRLYALEQLMTQAKKISQEQEELAQGFLQNQNRTKIEGDASVLPDLCTSHRRQLLVMLNNHNQLRDIRRRCTKAKEELSTNIYHRLKWIVYVENKITNVNYKLTMYNEILKRLKKHIDILQQIHLAPEMYMSAITEVVRRKTFSQSFLSWGSNLACQLLTIHNEELTRRREFQSKFDGHFLNTLFPGMDDTPPDFATQAPQIFDNRLPKLTIEDMESLRKELPDLALNVSSPDLNSITQFFYSKCLSEGSIDSKDKESTSMPVDISSKNQEPRPQMLIDRGDFESETDTEEFEKIGQRGTDSKLNYYDGILSEEFRRKESEVGVQQSGSFGSSTSTNISPLNSKGTDFNRSSSSSEPGSYHFPSLTTSERLHQLSPLTECIENGVSNSHDHYLSCDAQPFSNNPLSLITNVPRNSLNSNPSTTVSQPVGCDGQQKLQIEQQQQQQQQQCGSEGSSPVAVGGTDFMGTEFYMDESLPSSLSEHPTDSQHQAIVSLLQENLGTTQEEVDRLRNLLRMMKSVTTEALQTFRTELADLKGRMNFDESGIATITEQLNQAVSLHSNECKRIIQEREQELTVDHELEMADLKKMLQNREEDIRAMKCTIMEKETEIREHERLLNTMRQTLDNEKSEKNILQTRFHGQLETMKQSSLEKENALKEANETRIVEIASLTSSLTQCQERIQELEKTLAISRVDEERLVKEASDKLQIEYKRELETIRSRFKLMAASTMERSPSDSSLEKIERTDVIELVNHEAILAQTKEDMIMERASEISHAIEKERAEFTVKFDQELQVARQMVEEKERELEIYRSREMSLIAECERYKNTISLLTESASQIGQTLTKKVEKFHALNVQLENKIAADHNILVQRENQVYDLEVERNELRQELKGERSKNQTTLGHEETLSADRDEDQVSESKKVKLEADSDPAYFSGRVKFLEDDNKRLNAELRAMREGKEMAESIVCSLESDKVRLEIELVKERSKRNFAADSVGSSSSTSTEGREKDMSTSVAVVAEPLSRDVATSPEPHRRDAMSASTSTPTSTKIREKLSKSTVGLVQQGLINISSCNPGDLVLVLWDSQHRNYIIFQESRTMYFLNSDCINVLDLKGGPDGTPNRLHVVAEVIDKEYCHAKKPENRFRVPQGTKFYRVRVKPVLRMDSISSAKSQ